MPSPPLLATRHLTRTVDGTTLVDDVSLEVRAEEVFVVFGPSGSGKTSLLRLLNRLDEPTGGTVRLDGTDYREIAPGTLRRRVGWVPQAPTLTGGTVAENVAWGPTLRDEPVDEDRLHELLDRLGLSGFAERAADRLSGGEAQRVAIARTLFNDPDILLLDEPASSLDAAAADRVEALLHDVMTDLSLTAVLVTHDAERARRLGTRGAHLEEGSVTATGPIEGILSGAGPGRADSKKALGSLKSGAWVGRKDPSGHWTVRGADCYPRRYLTENRGGAQWRAPDCFTARFRTEA